MRRWPSWTSSTSYRFELSQALEQDPQACAALKRDHDILKRQMDVIVAAKSKDFDTLTRLAANDPALAQLAIRMLPPNAPGRGRKKMPRMINPARRRYRLCCAAHDVERIQQIWKGEFNKTSRTLSPTAVQIAARRWGFDVNDLIRYRKEKKPF